MKKLKKMLVAVLCLAMVLSTVVSNVSAAQSTPFYYVSIGDSSGAGYGISLLKNYNATNPKKNYKADNTACFSHLVADELASVYGYKGDLYDLYSNLCLALASTEDITNVLKNKNAYVSNQVLYGHLHNTLKVHDLMVSEIKKADVITVNVGNNDLIDDAVAAIAEAGTGTKYPRLAGKSKYWTNAEGESIEVFDNIENPIITAVWVQVSKLTSGYDLDQDTVANEVMDFLSYYMSEDTVDPLTIEDVYEALTFLNSSNLKKVMVELAQEEEERYNTLINTLLSINPNVELVLVGYYNTFGTSLTIDGKTYTVANLITTIRDIAAKDLVKATLQGKTDEYLNMVVNDVLDELTYPLLYLILGTCTEAGVSEYNSFAQEYANKHGYTYIDVTDITGESNTNTYLSTNGHKYFAQQIVDGMLKDITVEVEGSNKTTVTGLKQVIKGISSQYNISIEEGYEIDQVLINGKEVKVTNNQFTASFDADSTITVVMKEIINEEPETPDPIEEEELPFSDVSESNWFYSSVKEAYNLGLMTGKTETTFAPYDNLTRGQLALILYRMEGSPSVEYREEFSDVASGKYYSNAVIWAYDQGIVTGYGADHTFRPGNEINRQELALMLQRYASYKGVDTSANTSILKNYPDSTSVSSYAKSAMAWAVQSGLISGDHGKLNPKGTANRAQTAKMIVATYHTING